MMKKTYIQPHAEIVKLNLSSNIAEYEGGIDEGGFGGGGGGSAANPGTIDSGEINGKQTGWLGDSWDGNESMNGRLYGRWDVWAPFSK